MAKDWHDLLSQPKYDVLLEEDVWVSMRDGVRLSVDIYRPNAKGRFPAFLSMAAFGKETQKLPTHPEYQPSDPVRGTGGHECGEQGYFVPRGYVQVIPDIRGIGRSEGEFPAKFTENWGEDGYDLIQWMAEQPWCDGNIGMLGMSAFGAAQYAIAKFRPPQLKAIFPFEALSDRYRHNYYNGGILNHSFQLFVVTERMVKNLGQPVSFKEFSEEELLEKIKTLQSNPDIRCNAFLYNLTVSPWRNPLLYDLLLHPYDGPYYESISAYSTFEDISIPAHLGSRWDGWGMHLPGAFDAYQNLATPKENKKLLIIPSGMDRPFHEVQDVCLRWYDYWLKGIDTGIMDEPPILIYILGKNQWRYENEWPLKVTDWRRLYLKSRGRLSFNPPSTDQEPQTFTNNPWARAADPIPGVSYETEPLKEDMEVTGPVAFYWSAAIESKGIQCRTWKSTDLDMLEPLTNDTDWYLKIKDVDPQGKERTVAAGWLKASHYELDKKRSTPHCPYHPHTRSLPIEPGEVIFYASDMRTTSNFFRTGHRIRLVIAAQDPFVHLRHHLPHMAEVRHTIFSLQDNPSYILLPVIPRGYAGAGEPIHAPEGPFRIPA